MLAISTIMLFCYNFHPDACYFCYLLFLVSPRCLLFLLFFFFFALLLFFLFTQMLAISAILLTMMLAISTVLSHPDACYFCYCFAILLSFSPRCLLFLLFAMFVFTLMFAISAIFPFSQKFAISALVAFFYFCFHSNACYYCYIAIFLPIPIPSPHP